MSVDTVGLLAQLTSTLTTGRADISTDEAAAEARELLAHAMGIAEDGSLLNATAHVSDDVAEEAKRLVERRSRDEPVPYIIGRQTYRGLSLQVDTRTMVPRSDVLVDIAIGEPPESRLVDVGTGCGAIALAIKHERPELIVSGSDISSDAIDVAKANAEALGLDVEFSVADGIPPGTYDLVVANLPYLTQDERKALHPEMSYEPDLAHVVDSDDSLEIIRDVLRRGRTGTRIAVQHPLRLAADVAKLLNNAHLTYPDRRPTATIGEIP